MLKKRDAECPPEGMPAHIAIIMDGNGRWAKNRGLPRVAGHREGVKSVEEIIKSCSDFGVKALTLYAFSTENWLRPKMEVSALMTLLCATLRKKHSMLLSNNVRLMVSGSPEGVPPSVRKQFDSSIAALSGNTGMVLNIAFNYGGRREIVEAVNKIIASGAKKTDEKTLESFLYTAGLPDPDLIIRTSGEQRLSNFLLWQAAYSEFYFTPIMWPDFRKPQLCDAIMEFQKRQRRFGKAQ